MATELPEKPVTDKTPYHELLLVHPPIRYVLGEAEVWGNQLTYDILGFPETSPDGQVRHTFFPRAAAPGNDGLLEDLAAPNGPGVTNHDLSLGQIAQLYHLSHNGIPPTVAVHLVFNHPLGFNLDNFYAPPNEPYVNNHSSLVGLCGPPGTGKSALIASTIFLERLGYFQNHHYRQGLGYCSFDPFSVKSSETYLAQLTQMDQARLLSPDQRTYPALTETIQGFRHQLFSSSSPDHTLFNCLNGLARLFDRSLTSRSPGVILLDFPGYDGHRSYDIFDLFALCATNSLSIDRPPTADAPLPIDELHRFIETQLVLVDKTDQSHFRMLCDQHLFQAGYQFP